MHFLSPSFYLCLYVCLSLSFSLSISLSLVSLNYIHAHKMFDTLILFGGISDWTCCDVCKRCKFIVVFNWIDSSLIAHVRFLYFSYCGV